jgi:hypothetical protein
VSWDVGPITAGQVLPGFNFWGKFSKEFRYQENVLARPSIVLEDIELFEAL